MYTLTTRSWLSNSKNSPIRLRYRNAAEIRLGPPAFVIRLDQLWSVRKCKQQPGHFANGAIGCSTPRHRALSGSG